MGGGVPPQGPFSARGDALGRQKYIIPISGLIANHMHYTAKPIIKKLNRFLTPYTKQLLPLKPLLSPHLRFCLRSSPRLGSNWLVSVPVSIKNSASQQPLALLKSRTAPLTVVSLSGTISRPDLQQLWHLRIRPLFSLWASLYLWA